MPFVVDNRDLPVVDEFDIYNILPKFLRPEDPAPVRDAIVAALTAMMREYQSLSTEAVGMNNLLLANDMGLRGLGEDRGVYQSDNESDTTYRLRILSFPELVTPTVIVAAVNSILAPFTSIQCQYSESVQDRLYIGDSSARPWHSYVWDSTMSMSPTYPDRLYEDDIDDNLGYVRPNSNPGGARVYSDEIGRLFMIRIPDLAGIDSIGGFPNSSSLEDRLYVGGVGVSSGIRVVGTSTLDTFNNIVATIYRLKGHSIRFIVWADPKLTS